MQIYGDVNLITLNGLCPVEYSSPAITDDKVLNHYLLQSAKKGLKRAAGSLKKYLQNMSKVTALCMSLLRYLLGINMTSTGMFTIVQLKGMLYMSTAPSPQKNHCLEDTPNIEEVYKEFLLASLSSVCVCLL